ncbi:MAG TPA: hypothetical protein VHX86_03965 [Tepidisphaeraceae bacterium]|nr:hypothetical protein [Tepidisphaeraceae bacterium]
MGFNPIRALFADSESHTGRRCPGIVWAAGLLALAGSAIPARADLVFEAVDSSALAGGTGNFDIILADTGGTFSVSAFTVEPTVPDTSPVQFTGVTTNTTTDPYIFGTDQLPPLSYNTFPTTDLIALDADFTGVEYVTLNSGQALGLANVTYEVAPGASAGPVTISFASDGTSLSDVIGNAIPFTAPDGTITVVVPEPASRGLLTGLAGSLLLRRRAKK